MDLFYDLTFSHIEVNTLTIQIDKKTTQNLKESMEALWNLRNFTNTLSWLIAFKSIFFSQNKFWMTW